MTAPRIVVRGATTALTRRTTFRKAFLAPWHDLVGDCALYSLADAQRVTGVAVHSVVPMVTHVHTTGTPEEDNLPEFCRRFHRDLSCSLHDLLCELRYDAPRELFDDRPTHMMRLVDAAAQASHLVYEFLNPVAAGLVQRPEHMPMPMIDFRLWKVGYVEVERPPVYFSRNRPERLRLVVTPPPELYRAFGGDIDRLVYHLEKVGEQGRRAIRDVLPGPVLGAQGMRRLHPWSEPRTLRETGGKRVPTFRIGARGIVGRAQRVHGANEVSAFRQEHRATRIARRSGDLERPFPYGTYGMRVYHGAPVQSQPPEGALVTMPGPTLEEVEAELERERLERDEVRESSSAILDEVRGAVVDEATEMVEEALLDLTEPTPVRPRRPNNEDDASADEARVPLVVRHRFDKRRSASARRLVVLRDRRRGRRPRGTGPHGSDPPA